MRFISKIKNIIKKENFKCEKCEFQPENPKREFIIDSENNRMSSDFSAYICPKCNHKFNAIFCKCGNGYTCRQNFNRVIPDKYGNKTTYKCDCGEELHTHYRH